MQLRALRVRGFRNLAAVDMRPGPRATVIFGQNGQGKTNLLEAVHVLAAFRSFRTRTSADLVGWEAERARCEADLATGEVGRRLRAELPRTGAKRFWLDGKSVRRDAPALSSVAVVLFVPEDLLLPRAAPSERRRFVDTAVFGTERGYYREATVYLRLLKSRNAVLRRGEPDARVLDALDEQLAPAAARIVHRRRALVAALRPLFVAAFQRTHAARDVDIRYAGHPEIEAEGDDEAALARAFRRGLDSRRALDARRKTTGFGPHLDDLLISLDGRPAREHASQGQSRSLVLALKLAELGLLSRHAGEPPLLLLDDVASELDEERRRRLFAELAALDGQSLVTVTDRDLLPQLPERVDFQMQAGRLLPVL